MEASSCKDGQAWLGFACLPRRTQPMSITHGSAALSQSYLESLLSGDRLICRKLIDGAVSDGTGPYALLTDLVWPTMELVQTLYREDRINVSMLNMAPRLNRALTDQLTAQLPRKQAN